MNSAKMLAKSSLVFERDITTRALNILNRRGLGDMGLLPFDGTN
jgi:hypothetical protein